MSNALTQNNQANIIKANNKNMYTPIPFQWRIVLDYIMAGDKPAEVAVKTGYCLNSIYRILNHKNTIAVKQQLMEATQQRFEALYGRITDSIIDDLNSKDPERISDARKDWFKASGKTKDSGNNFSAENMVVQMLNGEQDEQRS